MELQQKTKTDSNGLIPPYGGELKNLIIKLQNKAKFVLIKDHFQYGFFSNLTIRVMDFLGNYFNDVPPPNKYFNKSSFNSLLKISNFKIVEKVNPDEVYHMASQSYVANSFDDEFSTFNTNINGTLNMLTAVKELNNKA